MYMNAHIKLYMFYWLLLGSDKHTKMHISIYIYPDMLALNKASSLGDLVCRAFAPSAEDQ